MRQLNDFIKFNTVHISLNICACTRSRCLRQLDTYLGRCSYFYLASLLHTENRVGKYILTNITGQATTYMLQQHITLVMCAIELCL